MSTTLSRKTEHLKICLKEKVSFPDKKTGFEDLELIYQALPEKDLNEVNIDTHFLGRFFKYPFIVSSMTGGCPEAEIINRDIALACQTLKIGMGLGSIRSMLENPALFSTYNVRPYAPDIFLAANVGIRQLSKYSSTEICRAVDRLNADALYIHINSAQEIFQEDSEGGFIDAVRLITKLASELRLPLLVKEVGNGISLETARKLAETPVAVIDVAGAGGTSWVIVDSILNKTETLNFPFFNVGIPTVMSLLECREGFKKGLIASGGIRTGEDALKALVLGAELAGIAQPVLIAQAEMGTEGIIAYFEKLARELKFFSYLAGAMTLEELPRKSLIFSGKALIWKQQRIREQDKN